MWKRVPGRKVAKSLLGREGGEVTTDWNHSTEHAVSNVMPRLQQNATYQALSGSLLFANGNSMVFRQSCHAFSLFPAMHLNFPSR